MASDGKRFDGNNPEIPYEAIESKSGNPKPSCWQSCIIFCCRKSFSRETSAPNKQQLYPKLGTKCEAVKGTYSIDDQSGSSHSPDFGNERPADPKKYPSGKQFINSQQEVINGDFSSEEYQKRSFKQYSNQFDIKENTYLDISSPNTKKGQFGQPPSPSFDSTYTSSSWTITSGPLQEASRTPSFNKEDIFADTSSIEQNFSKLTSIKDDANASSVALRCAKQTSFKDKPDINSPKTTSQSSVEKKFVMQTSFKDDKNAETSSHARNKSYVSQSTVSETSFNGENYADTGSTIANNSSVAQAAVRQTSFKGDTGSTTLMSSIIQRFSPKTSFKDDKHEDTSSPVLTKNTVAQQVARQTSFRYGNCSEPSSPITTKRSVAQLVSRETSFKEDKYTDNTFVREERNFYRGEALCERIILKEDL